MRTRLGISLLIFMMAQAVLFGFGAVAILATPLSALAETLMPWMIFATILVSAPFSWWLAPRLRARYWRHAPHTAADRTLAILS